MSKNMEDKRDYLWLAGIGASFIFAISVLCELAIPNGPLTMLVRWLTE